MKKFLLLSLLVPTIAFSNPFKVMISGMDCGGCAEKITTLFLKNTDVDKAEVDFKAGLMNLSLKKGKTLSDDKIKEMIKSLGYTVTKIEVLK